MTKASVFLREATGLVRTFSWRDMFIYNLYGTNWGIVLAASTLTGAFAFPGADMSLAVTMALVLLVFNALGTGWMAAALPRSGGDYVWNTYTLNHPIGFISGWGYFLNISFAIGRIRL